jgi:3-dehydroquinate synthase
MITLQVPFETRSYDIIIDDGILSRINQYVETTRQTVIITDDNIPTIYLDIIKPFFNDLLVLTIPQGESSKSMEMAQQLAYKMLEKHISRDAQIIALGGGVVGDLAGFVASIYMRGIDYIQIPTTVLSQVDSSVGGKVGVNTPQMKNALGAFKQPILVLIDPQTLHTLPQKHINNGVAEMIKYGLIASKSLFYAIKDKDIFADIKPYIHECLAIKRDIVLEDEKDHGLRQLLNYGHSIGHAIEQDSNYHLLHGEAIAIGMLLMAKETSFYEDLVEVLTKYNLPTSYEYDKLQLYNYIKTDKKASKDYMNIIIVEEVGKGYIKRINKKDILKKM